MLETAGLGKDEVRRREAIEEKELLEFRKKCEAEDTARYKKEKVKREIEFEHIGKQQQKEAGMSEELRNETELIKKSGHNT